LTNKKTIKKPVRRYYRKRVEIFRLIEKIKLWPSRRGLLHGIKTIEVMGDQARRNKWFKGACGVCRVPEWKLAKYSSTHFKRHYGSALSHDSKEDK